MKHKAFTLVEFIVVVVIIGILAAILYPTFQRPTPAYRSWCQSNLKQIGLGVLQYAQDAGEKYPPTQNAAGGWAALIQPYVKSDQIFQCPSDKTGAALKTTDYFYNARLSGVAQEKLDALSLTILAGDGLGDQPLNAHLSQLPDIWRSAPNSPARRHFDTGNYLFADGHVKALKPDKITLDKPAKGAPTFLIGEEKP